MKLWRIALVVFGVLLLLAAVGCTGLWVWCSALAGGSDGPRLPVLADARYERTLASADGLPPDAIAFVDDTLLVSAHGGDATGGERGGSLHFFRVTDGAETRPTTPLPGGFYAIAVSRAAQRLAVGVVGDSIYLYDLDAAPLVGVPIGACGTCALAFSPDGATLAIGRSLEGTPLELVDGHTGQTRRDGAALLDAAAPGTSLTTYGVTSVAYSPDGTLLAVARGERYALVLDAATLEVRRTFDDQEATTEHAEVAFSPDGHLLAHTSVWRAMRLHDLDDGRERGRLPWDSDAMDWLRASVVFDPRGGRLFHVERTTTVVARDTTSLALLGALGAVPDPGPPRVVGQDEALAHDATALAISPDGRWLAFADATNGVRVFALR